MNDPQIAEVTINSEQIGFTAVIKYRNGPDESLVVDALTPQSAQRKVTRHMSEKGFKAVSPGWHTSTESGTVTVSRLFKPATEEA